MMKEKRGPRKSGPKGSPAGRRPVGACTGTPEEVAKCEESYTGRYLKNVL